MPTLALYQAAQAWAGIHGREFVIPDDVKAIAPHVLTHRMMLSSQAQLRGRAPGGIGGGHRRYQTCARGGSSWPCMTWWAFLGLAFLLAIFGKIYPLAAFVMMLAGLSFVARWWRLRALDGARLLPAQAFLQARVYW